MKLAAMVFAVVQQMAVNMKQRLKGERKPEIRHFYTGANEVARRNPDYRKSDAIETTSILLCSKTSPISLPSRRLSQSK